MHINIFARGRRALAALGLTGALVGVALALGAASQSAWANVRGHHVTHHATLHRAHTASASSATTDTESTGAAETDGPGGPNIQSGSQSGPNDQSQAGGPDTAGSAPEGETVGSGA